MTGMNNTHFEQIKQAHRNAPVALDITKNYRTAGNHRVRALQIKRTDKVMVEDKEVPGIGRAIITGQVYMRDVLNNDHFNWIEQAWEANGTHLLHADLHLHEHKEIHTPHPSLF